jgi:hypothetical protein
MLTTNTVTSKQYLNIAVGEQRRPIERKRICYVNVIEAIPPFRISKSFDFNGRGGPYLLPELPNIVTNIKRRECDKIVTHFSWYDPISDVDGIGVVSLAMHVLNLNDERVAMWRIAKFCEPADYGLTEIHPRFFLDYDRVVAEIMGERRHG